MTPPHRIQPSADHVYKALPGLFALSGEGEWLQLVNVSALVSTKGHSYLASLASFSAYGLTLWAGAMPSRGSPGGMLPTGAQTGKRSCAISSQLSQAHTRWRQLDLRNELPRMWRIAQRKVRVHQ